MRTPESRFFSGQIARVLSFEKGGPGSGHAGHSGRHNKVGGSEPGGTQIGRADAPDAKEQFKFSGKSELRRNKGPHVQAAMSSSKTKGRFEVHGSADANGKTKKGIVTIRTNDSALEVSHDELHSLRSKVRFMQEMNDRNVQTIAGKSVARGLSLDVKVGGKSVSIPVNARTVREIDRAVHATRMVGYSLTAERRSQISGAVRSMQTENPVRVVKGLGFSKAGQLAAFRGHVERLKDDALKQILKVRAAGRSEAERKALGRIHAQFLEARGKGRTALAKLSGTQSIKSYRKAAVALTQLTKPGK